MTPGQILSADYLDILYDGRNKAYGGYELRQTERKRVFLALFSLAIPVSILCLLQLYLAGNEKPVIRPYVTVFQPAPEFETVLEAAQQPSGAKAPRSEAPAGTPAPQPTAPEIVAAMQTDTVAPAENIPPGPSGEGDKLSGAGDGKGEEGQSGGGGGGKEKYGQGQVEKTNDEPIDMADKAPAFQGDLSAYLRNSLRYPRAENEDGIEGRVVVRFIVERDGSVSDVQIARSSGASGLDNEARRVILAMPRWAPGTVAGQPVRTYFSVPVTFILE